jgi:hypothetical protein
MENLDRLWSFIEALKAGMELKQKFPHSQIKLQDARGVSLG